jgi:hypothetical protein
MSLVDEWPTAAPGRARLVAVALFLLTVGQLAVATFVPGLPQFEGKAFGSRLFAYPLLMAAPVAVWWLLARRRGSRAPLPWAAFAFVVAPFLVDVTGNTLDLYDSVTWWDDANHFANWLLLGLGVGLMLTRADVRPPWLLAVAVVGLGAVLAVAWELAEWWAFIRHGTEIDTAYTDTLGDEALGTLGAAVAGVVLAVRARRSSRPS